VYQHFLLNYLSLLSTKIYKQKVKYSPLKINKFKGNQCKNNNKNLVKDWTAISVAYLI